MEAWAWWLFLAGLAIGAVAVWLLLVRLPRDESDVPPEERAAEAAWIAATIERHGGVAPRSFVEEVLDLHQAYLRAPRAEPPERAGTEPPVDPTAPIAVEPPDTHQHREA